MAHTPGPWLRESQISSDGSDWILVTKEYLEIADLRLDEDGVPESEQEANASLIAAAPELHEACKHALHALNTAPRFRCGKFNSYDIASMLEHAIAKAEGRSDAETI